MRAVRVHEFGDPEVLVLEEVPQPEPVEGEVLVRIQAAASIPSRPTCGRAPTSTCPPSPTRPGATPAASAPTPASGSTSSTR